MSDVLVTGATGTVGSALTRQLLKEGRPVRALVRNVERARALVPEGVELVSGDVTDAATVRRGMEGVHTVYHAAGLPEQWRADSGDFTRVNVEGTRNMVEAALAVDVEAFVYTSTIDVFRWTPGRPFDESTLEPRPKGTHYERSKQQADRLVTEAVDRGLPARFLHPSAVYGPAPSVTPGANHFVNELRRNRIPLLLPGGFPVVFADDVADGHIAASSAPVGSRYILSESYRTLVEIAEVVRSRCATARVPRVLPRWVARALSEAGEVASGVTKRPPLIPKGQLHFLASHAIPVADRAARDLDWKPTPFEDGIARTLNPGYTAGG